MGLKKFVKKAGSFVKKAAAVYATYQTGGLAGVALGAAKKAASRKGGRVMAMPGGVPIQGGIPVQEAAFPLVATAARALPGLLRTPAARRVGGALAGAARRVGGALSGVAGTVATGVAGAVIADRITDAAGNVWKVQKRRRRINPLNVKAARRAIRRIKGVRRITAQIERSLPKQKSKGGGYCPPSPRKKRC